MYTQHTFWKLGTLPHIRLPLLKVDSLHSDSQHAICYSVCESELKGFQRSNYLQFVLFLRMRSAKKDRGSSSESTSIGSRTPKCSALTHASSDASAFSACVRF